jgi:phosphatidylserine/phosphatidylglycerophosphate/cardiolipin synthase-like enzyme
MRVKASENGVSVKAYSGTTGVLLGMNVEGGRRAGLLGFALERLDGSSGEKEWLQAILPFPGTERTPGELLPTNLAPVQRFRWSDYRVYPDTVYEYTVHPVYGDPATPEVENGPTVAVRTAEPGGEHGILFNRAAAASQAFSRRFPQVEEELDAARMEERDPPPLPEEALRWLSRGVLEQIVRFTEWAVDPTWALDVAIYEYELPEIVEAVNAAHARGARVRVVYHAKEGDEQTGENEHNLAALPPEAKRARLTSRICHHKFIVLSRLSGGTRKPRAVLCGSTNFTHNGVYRQANVVHVVRREDTAQEYLDLFEVLFGGADVTATRRYVTENNPVDASQPLFAGFSPRSGGADLESFITHIDAATRDVLFCTAFDLYDGIEQALLGEPRDPILRLGLQNSRSEITGYHRDRTADFVATAMLPEGLEGYLEESTAGQRGNILIHTKLVVVDFTSDSPTIISGSHNLSRSASESNDENFLIVRGNTDVADCYGCELMRLYDHYRFRWYLREGTQQEPAALKEDDSWTEPYFAEGSLEESDRLRFAGEAM